MVCFAWVFPPFLPRIGKRCVVGGLDKEGGLSLRCLFDMNVFFFFWIVFAACVFSLALNNRYGVEKGGEKEGERGER